LKPNHCKGDKVTIDSLNTKSPAPYLMIPSPTLYDLPFSHSTARLACHIVHCDPSKSPKVNDFHVI